MYSLILTGFLLILGSAEAQLIKEDKQDFSAKRVELGAEINKKNIVNNTYSIGLSNLKDIVHEMAYGKLSLNNSILYGVSGKAFILDSNFHNGQLKGFRAPEAIGVDACVKFNAQNSFYMETAEDVHVGISSLGELDTNASLYFDGNFLSLSPKVRANYAVGPSVKIDLKNDASLRLSSFISLVGFGMEQSVGLKLKESRLPSNLPSNLNPYNSTALQSNVSGSSVNSNNIPVQNIQIELYTPKGNLVKRSVFKADTDFSNTLILKFQVDMDGNRQVAAGVGTNKNNFLGTQDFDMNLEYKTPISGGQKKEPKLKQF